MLKLEKWCPWGVLRSKRIVDECIIAYEKDDAGKQNQKVLLTEMSEKCWNYSKRKMLSGSDAGHWVPKFAALAA